MPNRRRNAANRRNTLINTGNPSFSRHGLTTHIIIGAWFRVAASIILKYEMADQVSNAASRRLLD
jgi:hypothetical protein